MAQSPRKARGRAATRAKESADIHVAVPVPQHTLITVADLKGLNEKDFDELIEKVKTAKVGFVIINAPFKLRSVEPLS